MADVYLVTTLLGVWTLTSFMIGVRKYSNGVYIKSKNLLVKKIMAYSILIFLIPYLILIRLFKD